MIFLPLRSKSLMEAGEHWDFSFFSFGHFKVDFSSFALKNFG